MTLDEIIDFPYDPWLLPGVSRDAGDKSVETAWKLAGSPETGIIAQAYKLLCDEPSRLRTTLPGPRPFAGAVDAAKALKSHPVYLGPGAWYDTIARRTRS